MSPTDRNGNGAGTGGDAAPEVSFVIPVLNAAARLPACLGAIRRQQVPASRVEILVGDTGSTDASAAIARAHGARVLALPGLLAEPAKARLLREARGAFIAMLDADNEIAGEDWLARALAALRRVPDALGFESYTLKAPHHSRLNRHLTANLHISDPLARSFARPPRRLGVDAEGVERFALPADGCYPTGANGFIFPRRLLDTVDARRPFHDASFLVPAMRAGCRTLLRIRGVGIYHHYVSGWADVFRKRERILLIHLMERAAGRDAWDGPAWSGRKAAALLLHATQVVPWIEGAWNALRRRDPDWLLHGPASLVGLLGTASGALAYLRLRTPDARRRYARRIYGPAAAAVRGPAPPPHPRPRHRK